MPKLEELKKEYIRNILNVSLSNKDYSTVIFSATFPLDDVKGIIEELKDEFNIKTLIFLDYDYDKIKAFYDKYPKEKEVQEFIPKFSKPTGNIKMIYFGNSKTDYSNTFCSGESIRYERALNKYNKELYEIINNMQTIDQTVTILPNKEWAEDLLGTEDRLDELWLMISKTLLDPETTKKEAVKRIETKNELNKMRIRKLHFYTNIGTDFRISLNRHSLWACEPENHDGILNYFNYPSYEIFTSPNCFSAEGRIVLAQARRFHYDIFIKHAVFDFKNGRLLYCKSNDEDFDFIALDKPNRMNRIGEVALVSQDSPLSRLGKFYNSEELDENTGCHFALGKAIDVCIGVDKEKLLSKSYKSYGYNDSKYHVDLVFGNQSTTVEAELNNKTKVLIMENGVWRV